MAKENQLARNINIYDSSKEKNIRQGRLELIGDDAYLHLQNEKFEIFDATPFGLAMIGPNILKEINTFEDCEVYYKEQLIGSVHLRLVRTEGYGTDLTKYACEVIGEPIDIEKIKAIRIANVVTQKHSNFIGEYSTLPNNFKQIVFEMKDWLETLKTQVNLIDYKFDLNRSDELTHFENCIANIVGAYIVSASESKYKDLENSLKDVPKETLMVAFEFFRSKMKDLLLESPFHNRAFNKPLGYAGDYQMMNQIYAYEGLGGSLFAKCLHLYFISAPESRAVRNRARYLQSQITNLTNKSDKKIRIMSVASGPAMEVQYVIAETPNLISRIEFFLLDQDLESLQHAQRSIKNIEREKGIKVNCTFINKSIKNVIVSGLKEMDMDLIYSAGLFDYFTDPVAQTCAQRLYEALGPKGKLIIGNFSTSSPGKITMDIALDWHLIYRSHDDLKKLFSRIPNDFFIEHEREGINLFCHLAKDKGAK